MAHRRATSSRIAALPRGTSWAMPGPGELVLLVRGHRVVVHAQPTRRPIGGGGRFRFGAGGPQRAAGELGLRAADPRWIRIPPGGCEVFEGEGGHEYVCYKSHDGGFVNCYRIVHLDPWGPALP